MGESHSGNGSQDWESGEWFLQRVMFHEKQRAVKVLHGGAGDGRHTRLLLDLIFVQPASEVHAIGCYDGPDGERLREAFEENERVGGGEGRVHLYEGESREILAWMIAGEGYWESFDFIVLDGRPGGPELLADICQAWSHLKPGGVLDVAKSGPDCPVAQALLRVFSGRLDTVIESERLAVVKR